jgi:hypothetical protein
LERLKAELQRTQLREQTLFAAFHSKRADVVVEAFRLFVAAHEDFMRLTTKFSGPADAISLDAVRLAAAPFQRSSSAFAGHVLDNTLYFNEVQVGMLDEAMHLFRAPMHEVRALLDGMAAAADIQTSVFALFPAYSELRTKVAANFRQTLGVPGVDSNLGER